MNKNRLVWAARRGMLELDLLLGPFVDKHFDALGKDDKLRFEVLLEQEDQTLFEWFLKTQVPADPNMQRIVQIVRDSRVKLSAL
ncbi:MAG: succinate dehydrogenase assembly factor 2 [Porticoccaceae bacterium]|nr:succinate dehydrogenase assembly factor 2 [Porticoccaceae bacterium]